MYYFENFKGFTHVELKLFQPVKLSIVIGPNGSGKSNLIEAIELLSFIARGGALHEITELDRGGQLEVRGGLPSCACYGQNAFSLGFNTKDFSYSVTVQTKPISKIVKEKLFINSKLIFETTENNTNASEIDVKSGAGSAIKPVSAYKSVISQYHHFGTQQDDDFVKTITEKILKPPVVFEPNPKRMRQYEPIGSSILAKNGANLSAILFDLDSEPENHKILERLRGWIKLLPNEPYQDFDFDLTKYNSVMFGLKEGKNSVGANLLSDGTLRSLAVLTALETVEPHSLVVIEEFDNGLHPSRIQALIKAIVDCCQRQLINVVVTTHNPATLNALSFEQIEGVVLCTGDKLMRLCDLPRYPELLERGQLGELVTRRVIEQYLVPNFELERQKEALEWLKKLP
jgi:AAA15 family ATPase/GTPase